MDSLDYEQLLEELNKIIIKKRKITWNQLKEWANSKNIGFLTLSLLLEDLKEKMGEKIKFSEKKILVDEILEIYVPDEIIYQEIKKIDKEEKTIHPPKILTRKTREKRKEKKSARSKKINKSPKISILDFLSVEKRKEEKKEVKVKENILSNNKQKEIEEKDTEKHIGEITIRELADDKDMEIALSYLAKYWSVGEIRFIQDLKRLGVKDPKAVINRLLNKGYIERVNIGIINAKEIIKKYKITTPLSEIFNA